MIPRGRESSAPVDAPAARWTTKDPSFVESLGFPGDWSWSFSLNNSKLL